MAKLSSDDVKRIYRLLDQGLNNAQIAQRFNVATTTIWHVAKKRSEATEGK